jgi:hypothetical protein
MVWASMKRPASFQNSGKGNKTVSEENQTRLLSSATIKSKYFFIKTKKIKEQENLDNKKHRYVGYYA